MSRVVAGQFHACAHRSVSRLRLREVATSLDLSSREFAVRTTLVDLRRGSVYSSGQVLAVPQLGRRYMARGQLEQLYMSRRRHHPKTIAPVNSAYDHSVSMNRFTTKLQKQVIPRSQRAPS